MNHGIPALKVWMVLANKHSDMLILWHYAPLTLESHFCSLAFHSPSPSLFPYDICVPYSLSPLLSLPSIPLPFLSPLPQVMGNTSEFVRAVQLLLDNVSFDRSCTTIQVFEANIRYAPYRCPNYPGGLINLPKKNLTCANPQVMRFIANLLRGK